VWVSTKRGFYSVVAHAHDDSLLVVRSRARDDLLELRDLAPGIEAWREASAEYPWRADLPRDEWADVIAGLIDEIDYENFH
jgi:hypothetical protein